MTLDAETWLQAAPLSQPEELWNSELMTKARDLFNGNRLDERYVPMRLLQHSAEEIAGLKFFGSPYIGLTPRRQAMTEDNPLRYEGFARDPDRLTELYAVIPNHKMATPFCDFKTLTGFGFYSQKCCHTFVNWYYPFWTGCADHA